MGNDAISRYLYFAPVTCDGCICSDRRIADFTERHRIKLELPELLYTPDPIAKLISQNELEGLIVEMESGWLDRPQLKVADDVLKVNRQVWLYWPEEEAIEHVDKERLHSYRWLYRVIYGHRLFKRLTKVLSPLKSRFRKPHGQSSNLRELSEKQAGVMVALDLENHRAINEQPNAERNRQLANLATGDAYKDEVQNQWNYNPVGSQFVKNARSHTLEWFLEAEAYRYHKYAPWMPDVMEFTNYRSKHLLEIGGGLGIDLCQFAHHGAHVTDLDLSEGHLTLAREHFKLRGLSGRFIHHDAEDLPFDDNSFDVVYSNGVLHHTPNTIHVVREIHRVLKPGGRVIIMVYAQNSLHYWLNLVWNIGLGEGLLNDYSMGEIMSRRVEVADNQVRPLVKVYTGQRLRQMFNSFVNISIVKRQLTVSDLPEGWGWFPLKPTDQLIGWNLVLKAAKP